MYKHVCANYGFVYVFVQYVEICIDRCMKVNYILPYSSVLHCKNKKKHTKKKGGGGEGGKKSQELSQRQKITFPSLTFKSNNLLSPC